VCENKTKNINQLTIIVGYRTSMSFRDGPSLSASAKRCSFASCQFKKQYVIRNEAKKIFLRILSIKEKIVIRNEAPALHYKEK
jgi:hypothetical protein